MQVDGSWYRAHEVRPPIAGEPGAPRLQGKPGTHVSTEPRQIDVLQALDPYHRPDPGLFKCVTPYAEWTSALAAKNHLKTARDHGYTPSRRQELKRLALQEKRRRQKFDLALRTWANSYGLLGVGDEAGDLVPDIFEAVSALRAWAVPESEIWFAPEGMGEEITPPGSDAPIWMGKGPTPDWEQLVNAQAQLVTRSMDGEWRAPSLWAAMCHLVRNADALGIKFAMCSADDCFNPYVFSHGKRAHCSRRCANRARDHRLRLE